MLKFPFQPYFFDTEFNDRASHVELISVGITTPKEEDFYAVSNQFNVDALTPWLKANVLPKLGPAHNYKQEEEIREGIVCFVNKTLQPGSLPLFVGWYCTYDWYLVCKLFGGMMNIPGGWPHTPLCLRQAALLKDTVPRFAKNEVDEHNALADAKWTKGIYEALSII
jgi:hypothetical protein